MGRLFFVTMTIYVHGKTQAGELVNEVFQYERNKYFPFGKQAFCSSEYDEAAFLRLAAVKENEMFKAADRRIKKTFFRKRPYIQNMSKKIFDPDFSIMRSPCLSEDIKRVNQNIDAVQFIGSIM